MNALPNIISAYRGIAALAMLFFPVFSPWFWALYCWGGISDMIDGPLARKLGAVSEVGSRIDSVADLVFVICSAIMVLPSIGLPLWVWLWGAAIGLVKAIGIIIGSSRQRKLAIPTVIVCISGTASLFEDFQFIRKGEILNHTSG